jgi:hypothetical protein
MTVYVENDNYVSTDVLLDSGGLEGTLPSLSIAKELDQLGLRRVYEPHVL